MSSWQFNAFSRGDDMTGPDPKPADTTDEPEPAEPGDDDASDPSVADPTVPETHTEGEPA